MGPSSPPPDSIYDVTVNAGPFDGASEALVERAVLRALASAERSGGEISVTLLSDSDIQALNRDYLGRDRPTDVIAFSLGEGVEVLGDVYVGFEQAQRQALRADVPLTEELLRLTIHGTLHVLGHDHVEGPERISGPMFSLQERVLQEILDEDVEP
jgi:probable rRNA maturation factor